MERRSDNNSVFIIGGGPSLQGFDFSKLVNKHTIAVNKSFLDVPNLEYFVTVDHSFLRKIDKKALQNNPSTKVFVADLSYNYLRELDGRIVDTRTNTIYRLGGFDMIIKSRRKDGFGLSFDDFRTGKNSGYCALQLAIALCFKRIYLLGIDLCTQSNTHYHEGYNEPKDRFEKKLGEYFTFFKSGLEEIKQKSDVEIFNCSRSSRLNDIIPYKDLEGIL